MQWTRGKYSTVISGGIIGFIAFVFIFSGVFSPKSTRGLHEGAVAGTVNGDPIPIADFSRAVNQRMEFFRNIGGGKMSEEQLKAFRIKEGVFQELVRRKLLEQEASKQNLEASDEEVMDKIREIPAFKKDGKFDVEAYRKTLEANGYTPGSFERMVRSDLSAQSWDTFFQNRVRVSDAEVKQQFLAKEDKRNVKYVHLTTESGRLGVKVAQAEVDKFLGDATKANIAKNQYEAKKEKEFKGLTFDMVKAQIAREILSTEKIDEIKKLNEKLGDEVAGLMGADKASDAKVNAHLKLYKVEVKSTGLISADTKYLPGIGDAPDLSKDVFGPGLAKAKKYVVPSGVIVAVVTETQKPDLSKLDSQRTQLIRELAGKKKREVYDEWAKRLQTRAKIDSNPQVVGEEKS